MSWGVKTLRLMRSPLCGAFAPRACILLLKLPVISMAEGFQQKRLKGTASFQEIRDGTFRLVYEPTSDERIAATKQNEAELSFPIKLAEIKPALDEVTVYPKVTIADQIGFLGPKYEQIEQLSAEGLRLDLDDLGFSDPDRLVFLPSGFLQSTDYGLGLPKELRFIIEFVKNFSTCEKICVSGTKTTAIQDDVFVISIEHFEGIRKELNRIHTRATEASRILRSLTVDNLLGSQIGLTAKPISFGKHPITNLVGHYLGTEDYLDEQEQDHVINLLAENARFIASKNPEKLVKLTRDLEIGALEVLIERFESDLGRRLPESHWQKFFSENPFALQLVFGYPIIVVHEQAYVGGRKLDGSGDKITDYLTKNSTNSNCAIIEIKTPQTTLLTGTPYRANVYGPSRELAGSIAQTLDQKYHLERNIVSIKEETRDFNLSSYSIDCCLIVGVMPTDVDQVKSFELFRRNSKGVLVTTFDELCGKLKVLHEFLTKKTAPRD